MYTFERAAGSSPACSPECTSLWSTLLVGLINSHRRIHCLGVILNPAFEFYGDFSNSSLLRRSLHVSALLNWCWPAVPSEVAYFGAKLFMEHLNCRTNDELKFLLESPTTYSKYLKLPTEPDRRPKIIIVFRENLLQTFCSLQFAFITDRWCEAEPWASKEGSVPYLKPEGQHAGQTKKISLDWREFTS